MVEIHEHDGSVTFEVRVVPRSSKSDIVGELDGALKVKLKAPPVDGAANDELIRMLSKELGLPRDDVEIVSGFTSKSKRIRINDLTKPQILAILKAKS